MFGNRELAIITALLSVLSIIGCITSLDLSSTSIETRAVNYLKQESTTWDTFDFKNLNASLGKISNMHIDNLNFDESSLDYVLAYSDDLLTEHVIEINRTAVRVLELLKDRRYSDLKDLSEISVHSIPNKISTIFADVKKISFQKYLLDVSAFI